MRDCMRELRESGLQEAVLEAAAAKPLLGVCVGMQMLLDRSEEQDTPGLGLIAGEVLRFRLDGRLQPDGSRFKVPQMGWNRVHAGAAAPAVGGRPRRRLVLLRAQLLRRAVGPRATAPAKPSTACALPAPLRAINFCHPVPPREERRPRPGPVSQLPALEALTLLLAPFLPRCYPSHAADSGDRPERRPLRAPATRRHGRQPRPSATTRPPWRGAGSTPARDGCTWST